MAQPTSFHSEEADAIATITLDRPHKLNALRFDVYAELRDRFAALATRKDVRAVVITGAGRGFCSGGDVDERSSGNCSAATSIGCSSSHA